MQSVTGHQGQAYKPVLARAAFFLVNVPLAAMPIMPTSIFGSGSRALNGILPRKYSQNPSGH